MLLDQSDLSCWLGHVAQNFLWVQQPTLDAMNLPEVDHNVSSSTGRQNIK